MGISLLNKIKRTISSRSHKPWIYASRLLVVSKLLGADAVVPQSFSGVAERSRIMPRVRNSFRSRP